MHITLNNIEGKEVRILADRNFSKGSNEVRIDCSTLPRGLYFIHIRSNEKDTYKKLFLQ
jgi:hypothetical protein